MNKVFQDIYGVIWKEVFPGVPALGLEEMSRFFAADILLPQEFKSIESGEPVFCTTNYGYKRFISDADRIKKHGDTNNLQEKKLLTSLSETLTAVKEVAFYRGSKTVNSDVVEESDNVYSSSYVYRSSCIQSCQKVLFSFNMGPSEYMMASTNSKNSNFGIRVFDCDSVTNSFDVSFSGKCANCYFCHNCYDLRDCMFCFDISTKQYCIANIQLTKEEYEVAKHKIMEDYFAQLKSENSFKVLSDI